MHQSVYTALFPNRNKKQDKHPDYVMKWSKEEGTSKVELPEAGFFELAVWEKTDKNGNKYLSVAINKVDEQPKTTAPEETAKSPDGDEIPF